MNTGNIFRIDSTSIGSIHNNSDINSIINVIRI